MPAIHQFIAGFSRGDAISNEAVFMRDIFRQWGYASEIFSESKRILPELRREAVDVATASSRIQPADVVLLHLSIGSAVNEVFNQLRCRKVILYHNITPPEFFRGVQEEVANLLALGREQARRLAGGADLYLADSQYNALELEAMGASRVTVLPLVLDLEKLRQKVDRQQLKKWQDGKINVLFVGRVAPNKRIEDLLRAFYYFQRYVEPNSRLICAGSYNGMESYHAYQLTLQRDLELRDVEFTGSIPQSWLNAAYRSAQVFGCMSEHEGFGIPLIESMTMGVPVVAYSATAVPDTMDGAGICFRAKRFDAVAEMWGRVAQPGPFREAVLQGQQARIDRYTQRNLKHELQQHLEPLLN